MDATFFSGLSPVFALVDNDFTSAFISSIGLAFKIGA
tara:strand:+ start:359 stop:469 length:111 start_codon:yes stop_codon:yes gene_type:complete